MTRSKRIVLAVAVVLVSVVGVVGLTFVGSGASGPLGHLFNDLGDAVRRAESDITFSMRGPGRAADLAWFDAVRRDAGRISRPDRVLLGAYDSMLPSSFEGIGKVDEAIGEPLPLVHLFAAWGDSDEHRFPAAVAETVWRIGSVPVITWEPWLTTFDASDHPQLPPVDNRDTGGLAGVARGDYDFYLKEWFEDAEEFGQPVFVRFGHEMNDAYRYPWGPHNNTPDAYVAAFRHVVQTARESGAHNILWVWSPHLAYDGFEAWYPGDDVVDWVGATVLNYGTVAFWSEWWTFDDIFTRKYDLLASFGKPIMIAELGTLMAGGDPAPWFEQALTRLPQRLPEVKAVVFFHNQSDATITYQALDWAFSNDPRLVAAVRRGLDTWDVQTDTDVAIR